MLLHCYPALRVCTPRSSICHSLLVWVVRHLQWRSYNTFSFDTFLFAFSLVVAILVSTNETARGQVVIKERVAVTPGSSVMNRTASALARNYIVAPNDGTLQISLEVAGQIHNEIPESAYFRIWSRDTTIDGLVRDYASLSANGTYSEGNLCTGFFSEVTVCWRYPNLGYDHPLFFRVHAQDTIWFAYYSTEWNVETWADSTGELAWEILMMTNDPCYIPPLPDLTCQLKVEVADTVVAAFRVEALADTIAYGDTARIIVTAVNARNQEIALDGNTQLTFTLDSTRFGCFVRPTGGTSSSPLSNVTYSDARAGHVKFLANGDRDTETLKTVAVKVDGDQKTGTDTLRLAPITLSFDGAELRDIYPHLPRGNNSTNKRDTVDLTLHSHFRGLPKPNVLVKIYRPALVDSGGHSHAGLRPYSKFRWHNGTSWSTADSLLLRTDTNGSVSFQFLASSYGRIERLKATEVSSIGTNMETTDTVRIKTFVPSLVEMPEAGTYILTGEVPNHRSNHWINPRLRDSLTSACSAYRTQSWNRNHTLIRVNDIALPFGGGLDIFGAWERDTESQCASYGHCSHREGEDVDIENLNNLRKLIEIFENRRMHFIDEGQFEGSTRYPHFRLQ
jgi:hypothetical protein